MKSIRFEKHPSDKAKWQKIMLLICVGMVISIPYITSPESLPLPECTFKSITGDDCPTCGVTRSMFAISHGMIIDALKYHFAGIFIYIGLLILAFKLVLEVSTGWIIHIKLHKKVIISTILMTGGSWFLFWMAKLFINI